MIHYDVARSPQLYIHRSGRTARANATGTAISLIAPEDSLHHTAICEALAAAGDKAIIHGTATTNSAGKVTHVHPRYPLIQSIVTRTLTY